MKWIYPCLLFVTTNVVAQDSLSVFKRNLLAPSILISAGLIASTDNEVFDRYEIYEARNEHFPHFHTGADNYLQFAPIVAAYALESFKVKGVHNVGQKTVQLLKAELFMTAIVFPMKHLVGEPRPDTGERNSFPSGHTAQAFAAATFLHKEYGHRSIWYSIGAYTVATSVGAMRVLNDRHWASDVLVGAGIGILATNLAYMTERKDKHARHINRPNIKFIPTYGQGTFQMSIFLTRL